MQDDQSKRKRPDKYIDELKEKVKFLEGVRDLLVKEAGDAERLEQNKQEAERPKLLVIHGSNIDFLCQ